jgi:hypothetical protein
VAKKEFILSSVFHARKNDDGYVNRTASRMENQCVDSREKKEEVVIDEIEKKERKGIVLIIQISLHTSRHSSIYFMSIDIYLVTYFRLKLMLKRKKNICQTNIE